MQRRVLRTALRNSEVQGNVRGWEHKRWEASETRHHLHNLGGRQRFHRWLEQEKEKDCKRRSRLSAKAQTCVYSVPACLYAKSLYSMGQQWDWTLGVRLSWAMDWNCSWQFYGWNLKLYLSIFNHDLLVLINHSSHMSPNLTFSENWFFVCNRNLTAGVLHYKEILQGSFYLWG